MLLALFVVDCRIGAYCHDISVSQGICVKYCGVGSRSDGSSMVG